MSTKSLRNPSTLDLSDLPPAIGALAERGTRRSYRKSTLLIEEGNTGDAIYVILSGRVKVFALGPNDREITFGIYGRGDYVGEMSLDGGPRSASVITLEATECAVISRETLRTHIAQYPDFALELLARVIRRARLATESARSLALIDVYGRLTRLLDGLAVPQPDGTRRVEDRITHADMASRLGCSREMVSRLLKDLEQGGYLTSRERKIVLLKRLPERW